MTKGEAKLLLDRLPDSGKGRQRFRRYVEDIWFPHHVIELRRLENYELRVKDIALTTRLLTVSRVVIELSPKHHPEGGRFLVKDYPKDREHRTVRISAQITNKVQAHIQAEKLDDEALLFFLRPEELPRPRRLRVLLDPQTLGYIESDRRYRHGTLSGYSAGECRCQHCKDVYADYRARRREAGKDSPRRRRMVNTDGHIPFNP